MSCCDGAEFRHGWEKATAAEGLCFRFVRLVRTTYMNDTVLPPGDYIVKCPALNLTFPVKAADFEKYFAPLMQDTTRRRLLHQQEPLMQETT
jgi:hypothetical protein